MRICSSELTLILIALFAFSDERFLSFCSASAKLVSNNSSKIPSEFDSDTFSNASLFTTAHPDVSLENKAETPAVSVAQLSVGNKTLFAISSNDSESGANNFTVNGDSNLPNNVTYEGHKKGFNFFRNKGAMLRAFYVAVGILVIITIYTFVVSRLKKRKTKRHMYGLLTKHTDVELTPLGQDEEDDEHTVFDAVQYKS